MNLPIVLCLAWKYAASVMNTSEVSCQTQVEDVEKEEEEERTTKKHQFAMIEYHTMKCHTFIGNPF